MKSTPETIAEAQRALASYMESVRRQHRGATGDAGAVFYAPAISFDSFNKEDCPGSEREALIEKAKRDAEEYCLARNQGLRPVRRKVNETDDERDAREQAMQHVEARRKSVIRK